MAVGSLRMVRLSIGELVMVGIAIADCARALAGREKRMARRVKMQ